MVEAESSLGPSVFHRVFYGPSELRAGWRLFIFLAIVITVINARNQIVSRLLHGADDTALFFVREVGRLSDLPPRQLDYGEHERQGRNCRLRLALAQDVPRSVLAGCSARLRGHHWFVGCHASRWCLLFWKHRTARCELWRWAIVYVFVFILVALREEFRARGYGLFTLSTGIGFSPAAILSAAFFGYSHHGNSGEDWVGLFNAGAFGLLACLLLRQPVISGCGSDFTWPSTGARHTSMVWPTVAISCPVIF